MIMIDCNGYDRYKGTWLKKNACPEVMVAEGWKYLVPLLSGRVRQGRARVHLGCRAVISTCISTAPEDPFEGHAPGEAVANRHTTPLSALSALFYMRLVFRAF
jgi:hypothetical protein